MGRHDERYFEDLEIGFITEQENGERLDIVSKSIANFSTPDLHLLQGPFPSL